MRTTLRIVLAIAGLAIVFLGLNVGLGGIMTLGWQGGDIAFVTVTDAEVFAIRDNHIRFIGGVWLGAGLVFLTAAVFPERLRTAVAAISAMIFVGGLARFSAPDPALLADAQLAPSLLLELVFFPLLGFWTIRATRFS